jgi:hypothetical protein
MGLGKDANYVFLRDLFDVLYPRKSSKEIEALAASAADEIEKISAQAQLASQQANTQAVTQRVRHVLVRAGIENNPLSIAQVGSQGNV